MTKEKVEKILNTVLDGRLENDLITILNICNSIINLSGLRRQNENYKTRLDKSESLPSKNDVVL